MKPLKWHLFALALVGLIAVPAMAETARDASLRVAHAGQSGGLTFVLDLSSSVQTLTFGETYAFQRKRLWRFDGDGWKFDGNVLRRADGGAFSSVEFEVLPDDLFVNRRYVVLGRVGVTGWTVFMPALMPAQHSVELGVDKSEEDPIALLGRRQIIGAKAVPIEQGSDVLLYVGPREYVREGSPMIIAGPEIPEWLIEPVQVRLDAVLARMEALWGVPPPAQPIAYLSAREDDRGSGFKGGALADGAVTLRTSGLRLDEIDETLVEQMLSMVSHEAVHLWLGQRYENSENADQPWLHEGVTEYLSDRLWNDDDEIREELGQRLNACASRLGEQPLRSLSGDAAGSVHYDCGYVINAVVERAAIRAAVGSIVDVWRQVTSDPESRFDVEKFLKVLGELDLEQASGAVDAILHGSGPDRWQRVHAAIEALGIQLDFRKPGIPEGPTLRAAALMPALGNVCDAPYGFTTFDEYLELDTGDRCVQAINGNPSIVAAGGHSLFSAPFEAFGYIQKRCKAGESLTLIVRSGESIQVPSCSVTIADPPPVAVIRAFPGLPRIAVTEDVAPSANKLD